MQYGGGNNRRNNAQPSFVNPYNFVPFGKEIIQNKKTKQDQYRSEDTKNKPLKSGWLEVSLYTRTPLILPDGAHPKYYDTKTEQYVKNPKEENKKFMHKEYDFIKREIAAGESEYYIPGSSIRGMLRSVYEAATDSCVPFLLKDPDDPISQRVPLYAALKRRGLLAYEEDGSGNRVWRLYTTTAQLEKVDIRKGKEGIAFYRKKTGSQITDPTGSYVEARDAYIQYNVPVNQKQAYNVAYLKPNQVLFTWEPGNDDPYNQLRSVLKRDNVKGGQRNPNRKQGQSLLAMLEAAHEKKDNMVPVYFFTVQRRTEDGEETLVYLSNSAAGRIAQHRNWEEIIGEHKPCTGNKLCPACLLFGNITCYNGLKSKVRISDATSCEPLQKESLEQVTLDILGEPRTSAFEFYLERPKPKANYWNFDFYGVSERDEQGKPHTVYYDLPNALPRGRKIYWHGKPVESKAKDRMNATMSAVKEGRQFTFRVYYDEITEKQLQDLIWTITLGDNRAESNMQHKLGHAKPLGYGSVKLTVDKIVERSVRYDEEKGIQVSLKQTEAGKNPKPAAIDLNAVYVQSLLKITDANVTKEKLIKYPSNGDGMIFTWFSGNRRNAKGLRVLPAILDEDITNAENGKR